MKTRTRFTHQIDMTTLRRIGPHTFDPFRALHYSEDFIDSGMDRSPCVDLVVSRFP
jgi:hypothetical protein